jgi:hypothetical protein
MALKIGSLAKTAREYFGTGIFSDNSSQPEPRPPLSILEQIHSSAKMNGPVFTPPGGNAQGADAQAMAAVKSVCLKLVPRAIHSGRQDIQKRNSKLHKQLFRKLTLKLTDASAYGILSGQNSCLWRYGLRSRRGVRSFHGFCSSPFFRIYHQSLPTSPNT